MKLVLVSTILLIAVSICGCTSVNITEFPVPDTSDRSMPVFDKNQKIIVFAAHPDDEAIGAATIMSRTIKNGGDVELVITTDGAPREFGHGEFEAGVRKNETIRAMSLIGVPEENIRFLDYDDRGFIWEIDVDEEISRIADIIEEERPSQVYIHAYEGGHIDHDATHYLVTEALKKSDTRPKVYEFPEYNGYYWGKPIPEDKDKVDNEHYPILTLGLSEEEKSLKKKVIKQYISQHPIKSNLIPHDDYNGLKIVHLSVDVNGVNQNPNDLKSGNHYMKIAEMDLSNRR